MTEPDGLVEWARTARRMRASALVLLTLTVAGWLVTGLVGGELTAGGLFAWLGLALGVMFVVEVVVVGGSAVRGMLRAGERGERLASGDVGLLPATRRRSVDALRSRRSGTEQGSEEAS